MKLYKPTFLIILLIIVFNNCVNKEVNIQNITSIDLYYIPFGSLFHNGGFNEVSIKELEKVTILDEFKIQKLSKSLKSLRELKNTNSFQEDNIYLLVDFIDSEGNHKALICDRTGFKFGKCYFNKDEELINLIIKEYKSSIKTK